MSIRIIHTLFPVTLQDEGRQGFRAFGIPVSGPMDPISYRLANMLCGNPSGAVALEITLHGLHILFEEDVLISICGGGSLPVLDGEPLGCFRPLYVKQGSLIEFKPSATGCRMYLAMAGGFKADEMMGSRSTYVSAAIGGLEGRVLRKGDRLMCAGSPALLSRRIRLDLEKNSSAKVCAATWGSFPFPNLFESDYSLRFLPGPEWDGFMHEAHRCFLTESFQVTDRSDRMGYQLSGPVLKRCADEEMLSTGVCPGTVQVTHAGEAVILMADGQTTGGYPRIAQIITADIALCGQRRPGSTIRFISVSTKEALDLLRSQTNQLLTIERSIRIRYGM